MKITGMLMLFILFFNSIFSIAQDFAPIGAEWHYSESFAFSGDIDYLMITSIKDTIISGKQCRKLDCDDLCWNPSGPQFVHMSNDSLFFFDQELEVFQLIAAFNAVKNNSWTILVKDWDDLIDTVLVTVDSVYTTTINQNDLKTLDVTYTITDQISDGQTVQRVWITNYSSKIIDRIGDVEYLFNFPKDASMACDVNYSDGLRCYKDNDFGLYSTGLAESCTYTYNWTGIKDNSTNQQIDIFPNPTTGIVTFSTQMDITVEISDLTGKSLMTKRVDSDSRLDISEFPNGIYILITKDKDKTIGFRKLIKY